MSKCLFMNGNQVLPTSGTVYCQVQGCLANNANEARMQHLIPTPGVIKNLYVTTSQAAGLGTEWTFTLMKVSPGPGAGSAQSITTTIGGTAQTENSDLFSATGHSVEVAAEDYIDIRIAVTAGSPAAGTQVYIAIEFWPTIANETILFASSGASNLATAGSEYGCLAGHTMAGLTTEVDASIIVPCNGTFKKLFAHLGTAPGGVTARTFALSVDTISSALSLDITGANTTGSKTDTDVPVTAGQVVSIRSTVTGTPAAGTAKIGIVFVPDSPGQFIFGTTQARGPATGATNYQLPAAYPIAAWNAAPATMYVGCGDFTVKAMYVKMSGLPGAGKTYTFYLYKNGAEAALSVQIDNSSVSGNAAADIAIAANDIICVESVPAGTPTARNAFISFLGEYLPLSSRGNFLAFF